MAASKYDKIFWVILGLLTLMSIGGIYWIYVTEGWLARLGIFFGLGGFGYLVFMGAVFGLAGAANSADRRRHASAAADPQPSATDATSSTEASATTPTTGAERATDESI